MNLVNDIKDKLESLSDSATSSVDAYKAVLTHDDVVNCNDYTDEDDNAIDMLDAIHTHASVEPK